MDGPVLAGPGHGLRDYYRGKIEELEIAIKEKQHNLRRIEAQRNELNSRGAWPAGSAPTRDWDGPPPPPQRCPSACLPACSAVAQGRAAAAARARQLCGGGDQGEQQLEGAAHERHRCWRSAGGGEWPRHGLVARLATHAHPLLTFPTPLIR